MITKQPTLYIHELRFKAAIAPTLSEFYNPTAVLILTLLLKNTINDEYILIPNTLNSILNHSTFIERNNERVLKKLSIPCSFNELPLHGFACFFFLMEAQSPQWSTTSLLQQFQSIASQLPSLFPTTQQEAAFLQELPALFRPFGYRSLFLLKINIPLSNHPLEIQVSNDVVVLDAVVESLL